MKNVLESYIKARGNRGDPIVVNQAQIQTPGGESEKSKSEPVHTDLILLVKVRLLCYYY